MIAFTPRAAIPAPGSVGSRDRFIGWDKHARLRNIALLAYNTRVLILPWVTVPHLASHILGRMARTLCADWCGLYAHPIYYLETFIDPQRFRGTCYRAANWSVLGMTTGRGKADLTHPVHRSIKQVLGYPLVKDSVPIRLTPKDTTGGSWPGARRYL